MVPELYVHVLGGLVLTALAENWAHMVSALVSVGCRTLTTSISFSYH